MVEEGGNVPSQLTPTNEQVFNNPPHRESVRFFLGLTIICWILGIALTPLAAGRGVWWAFIVSSAAVSLIPLGITLKINFFSSPKTVTIAESGVGLIFRGERTQFFPWDRIDEVATYESSEFNANGRRTRAGAIRPSGMSHVRVSFDIAVAIQKAFRGQHHYEQERGRNILYREGALTYEERVAELFNLKGVNR